MGEKDWDGTGFGVAASTKTFCLDVREDATTHLTDLREHQSDPVLLVECPSDTTRTELHRVWSWQPFQNGKFVTEAWHPTAAATGSTAKFSLHDLGLKVSTPASLAMTTVAVSLLAAGIAVGAHRARRVT